MASLTTELQRGFELAPVPAGTTAVASRAAVQRQSFRMAGLQWLLRYEQGNELCELPTVHRLPNAPGWFAGTANLHGVLVPVFDLAPWLGGAPAERPMLLVVGHGADATGLVIDGLPRRLSLADAEPAGLASVPQRVAAAVPHAWLADDRLHFELDATALCDVLERSLG